MLATNSFRERWPETCVDASMGDGIIYADGIAVLRRNREGKVTTEPGWHKNGQTRGEGGHFPNISIYTCDGRGQEEGRARQHPEEPPQRLWIATWNVLCQPLDECEPEIHTADIVLLREIKPKKRAMMAPRCWLALSPSLWLSCCQPRTPATSSGSTRPATTSPPAGRGARECS